MTARGCPALAKLCLGSIYTWLMVPKLCLAMMVPKLRLANMYTQLMLHLHLADVPKLCLDMLVPTLCLAMMVPTICLACIYTWFILLLHSVDTASTLGWYCFYTRQHLHSAASTLGSFYTWQLLHTGTRRVYTHAESSAQLNDTCHRYNSQTHADRQTGWQTGGKTDRQTGRWADR